MHLYRVYRADSQCRREWLPSTSSGCFHDQGQGDIIAEEEADSDANILPHGDISSYEYRAACRFYDRA